MDSIEQLREIYWDLDLPLRRRIEAAAICIQYQGFGEAFDFLKRVGSEPEVAPSLRILALKYTAQYETRRKPPPTPHARDSVYKDVGAMLIRKTRENKERQERERQREARGLRVIEGDPVA